MYILFALTLLSQTYTMKYVPVQPVQVNRDWILVGWNVPVLNSPAPAPYIPPVPAPQPYIPPAPPRQEETDFLIY